MFTTRRRAALRAATAFVAAGALVGGLTACAGGSDTPTPAESIPAEGVDDGSTLTLWTRAPMEAQANLLVDAYNASHENQVELTVVPNDDYVAKVGAAAGSVSGGGRVSLSSATADQLDELPGIGPVTADAIIAHRTAHGGFQRVEDLLDVKGIGEKTLADLRDLVSP